MPVVGHLEALMRPSGCIARRRIWRRKPIYNRTGHEGADEISQPVGDEVDEALSRGADFFTRTLVGINLPGDKEEIVADPVQQNAEVEESHHRPDRPHPE